jgi:TRAP-type C4-dicarboxylate transport system permease small subunit
VEFLSALLQSAALCIMVWAMYRNTLKSYNNSEAVPGVVPIDIWPVKAFVCVGLVIYLIQVLLRFWDKTLNLVRARQAD